ncbi:hypothetical protein TNCV_4892941 [Trichonephila clavipes]|nr:hypothetical protein TNCV_4892941 [Trichonephila clavipes]
MAGEAVSLHSLLVNRNSKIYRQNFEADDFPSGAVALYKVVQLIDYAYCSERFKCYEDVISEEDVPSRADSCPCHSGALLLGEILFTPHLPRSRGGTGCWFTPAL